ncbi:hypothetical protein BH24ACT3_BH24ACT3_15900 [soil metagenome]
MFARVRRWILPGLVLIAVLWLVGLAVTLLQANAAARAGFDHVEEARRATPIELLADSGPAGTGSADTLAVATEEFDRANARLRSPLVASLRVLPVLGRQLQSARVLTGAAAEATSVAVGATSELRPELEGEAPRGTERVRVLQRVALVADKARRRLATIELGPDRALVAPLGDARDELDEALRGLGDGLSRASVAATGAADFLAGPSTYLVLGANNAEMRAGSGMFLSAGLLEVTDGRFELGDLRPTQEMVLPPDSVPVGGDLAVNWSWLDPGRDFRNLALTPRFAVSAELARAMWEQVDGTTVDGVLAIDPDGLRAILAAVGPIEVEGVEYSVETVRRQLLHDQYVGVRGDDERDLRRERLGDVARAALDALETRDWDVTTLIDELAVAAQGRHLLLWSADEAEQQAWEAARLDGSLVDRSLAVSVINRGGNKLDWFLEDDVTIELDGGSEGPTTVTVRVALRNTTPDGEPSYIIGPTAPADLEPAEYGGIVTLHVPAAAMDVTAEGGSYLTLNGVDGPSRVVGTFVEIPQGSAEEVVVRFTLPAGVRSLTLEPSARVPGAEVDFDGRSFARELRRTVRW